ncbi:MAG: hypothetical protein MHPSP_003316, partial [Paramarteilia canceri]
SRNESKKIKVSHYAPSTTGQSSVSLNCESKSQCTLIVRRKCTMAQLTLRYSKLASDAFSDSVLKK